MNYFGQIGQWVDPVRGLFGINSQGPTQADNGNAQHLQTPSPQAMHAFPPSPQGTIDPQYLTNTPSPHQSPRDQGTINPHLLTNTSSPHQGPRGQGTINPHLLTNTPSPYQSPSIQHAGRFPPQFHQSPRPIPHPHSRQQYQSEVYDLTGPGPKQSRKPAPTTAPIEDQIRANRSTWDPKVLLAKGGVNGRSMPSGAPTNNDSGSATAEADTPDEGVGMSQFMGQLHRIVNRDSVPQRKRKSEVLDEDESGNEEHKKHKATMAAFAPGGAIAEHLREQNEKVAAEAARHGISIDLTNDDDNDDGNDAGNDDLVFVGEKRKVSEANKEVCLGVLQGKANISRIPMYAEQALNSVGKESWPRLKLTHCNPTGNDMRIELKDRTNRVVGLIEHRVAAALAPLLKNSHINHLRLTVSLANWLRNKGDRPGQHISKNLDIAIIVYAPRKHGEMIGVHIGKEIENPHVPGTFGPGGVVRKPQTQQPVSRTIIRDPNELRQEAKGMFDKMIKHEDLAEMEADPTIIKTPLMPHQKQGLQFLMEHEHTAPPKAGETPAFSLWKPERNKHGHDIWVHVITGQEVHVQPAPVKGGILADMMGLGKTLSILSLIAQTKREAEAFGEEDVASSLPEHIERNAKTTIIICPKSVMSNWFEQIKAHVKGKKLTYYTYHGSNRKQDLDELAQYDIVLTTYGTAAEDKKGKGKALFAMNWFRVVLDEAHGIRNQNTGISKACIELPADRRWAVTGTPVQNGLNDMGALVKFLRMHPFDNSSAWNNFILLPLKSGNTDVIAHLRMLVDSITLRRLKDKIGLKDRKEIEKLLDFSESDRKWYDRIATQSSRDMMLMTGGKSGMKGKAYAHMLRLIDRMRRFCAHGRDMFNDEDRRQIEEGMDPDNAIAIDLGDEADKGPYEFIGKQSAYETLNLMSESEIDRCDKCGNKIVEKPVDEENSGDDEDETSDESDSEDSSDAKASSKAKSDVIGYLNPCFHVYCPKCKDIHIAEANQTMTADQRYECDACLGNFVRFGLFELRRSELQEYLDEKREKVKKRKGNKIWDNTNYEGPSAKVLALIADLKTAAAESEELETLGEPPVRSVVFSQWTSYLDLIEVALNENGIGFTRLDGSMSISARTRVMDQFKTDPNITVILVSIKAGGQGLNFTAASKVFMMEPQYNPGVEQQAIDRVHRLGQKRNVLITHYFMTNTIEQKIKELQVRKIDLAQFTLEKKMSKVEEAKARIANLRDLFR
ncbi:hypothetical protein LTR56_000275 [Elasticomyces elasticus]|nr:hypothetical protein LTR56_000275 [Elasticomyces elasticus]KAK4911711.1 hypothetical protein LTR49_019790 [Elasticomyces elasticus]